MSDHPFDRYATFTDLSTLKEYSAKPLRRCVRVNTLLSSVEELKDWAAKKQWKLESVPWCATGFFVDRDDRSIPLGKDLLHLLGHFYFQEASSMLPVALLQPQPQEIILDMSAAPGSKTTQIAACMDLQGVVIANDIVDNRLKTLKSALQRSGVLNVIITKKVGQWFAKHMTERFDRVLLDAPCTGQGTSRKDPDALEYCSEQSIRKSAKLQRELLESALHATKIGGRIVYSTCTLTPEENEEVVQDILNKFSDQVEVIDPRKIACNGSETKFDICMHDSGKVQSGAGDLPFLRIWPQTYNTEGFFCAVLQKTASTRQPEHMEIKHFREMPVPKGNARSISAFLSQRYGVNMIGEHEQLFDKGDHLLITTQDVASFPLPVMDYSLGMPFGRRLRDIPVYIDHEMAVLRGGAATLNVCHIDEDQLQQLLRGSDISCDAALFGHVLVHYGNWCIGRGRARNGVLKNHLPRWMIYQMQDVV
ncbi:hypothetical protein COU76_00585 [Candidatus Peregrinibacteria bacterium CG10_big_fil_rev_8_21_14_0_10_49_10]|nr:MAG: hypothetical protein COU76_00585 [Candidatus Peregrinibacteria bacterium CG10_big_fil_rev_8_21_14_0_10_49_10]